MKAVILTGAPGPDAGRADEADTRVQAELVRGVLEVDGWSVAGRELAEDPAPAEAALRAMAPDLVFNLVEAVGGRGDLVHLAPELLDRLGLPHTGCPARAMRLTSDKLAAKRELAAAGLPTPKTFDATTPATDGSWIVKSVWEHASLGMDGESVVPADAVAEALETRRRRLGGAWFAERFVEGREFNLALLEDAGTAMVLPPAEIDFSAFPPGMARIVDYAAKWDEASFEYRNTPRRFDFAGADRALLGRLRSLSLECWRLFGLRGYARVDFRVDGLGEPWILEVNANPCLSADAGFMAAAARAGLGHAAVIRRIVRAPLRRPAAPGERAACS